MLFDVDAPLYLDRNPVDLSSCACIPLIHACLLAGALVAGPAAGAAAEPPASTAPQPARDGAATSLEFRTNPLLDLHLGLRAAAGGGELPAFEGASAAVEAIRTIDRALGSPLAWSLLDGAVAEAPDLAAVRTIFAQLPEERAMPGGGTVALRARALELVDALAAAEPRFMAEAWPARRAAIDMAREALAKRLLPHQRECYEFLLSTLGMKDPGLEVPVCLVTNVPPFGGITYRRLGGKPGGTCVVGVADNSGTLLDEAVLHESLHALDTATAGQPTVLNRLRTDLEAAGIPARSRTLHDVPHTIMFVEAGEAVRRFIDPKHVPFGEAKGYYAKVPEARDAVVQTWMDRLANRIGVDEAVAKVVTASARPEAAAPRSGAQTDH